MERNPVGLEHGDQLSEGKNAKRWSEREGQGQLMKVLKAIPKDMNLFQVQHECYRMILRMGVSCCNFIFMMLHGPLGISAPIVWDTGIVIWQDFFNAHF